MRYFDLINEAWSQWVDQKNAPVRVCVESKFAHPGLFVEIQVIAVKNPSKL